MNSDIFKEKIYMTMCCQVAKLSNCIKRKTGAMILKDKMIISVGYNGTPKRVRNCNKSGCKRCNSNVQSGKELERCICVHSEENAIVQAAYNGISTKDGVMFCTNKPCNECLKLCINAGIKEIVYNDNYNDKNNKELLKVIKIRKLI